MISACVLRAFCVRSACVLRAFCLRFTCVLPAFSVQTCCVRSCKCFTCAFCANMLRERCVRSACVLPAFYLRFPCKHAAYMLRAFYLRSECVLSAWATVGVLRRLPQQAKDFRLRAARLLRSYMQALHTLCLLREILFHQFWPKITAN